MTDPYKVLGVARDASDEEIKNTYRALARKYHPDNFTDNETARSMAEDKMKEINEAYDAIQKERKNGTRSGYGSYSSDASYNAPTYATVRSYINSNRIDEADGLLESIAQNDRGAEWHFLKGCVCASKGWNFEAQNHFTTACTMDPSNAEYQNALNRMRGAAGNYNTGYNTTRSQGCSGCDICSALLCADCLCQCMGGDLIKCC